jgi:hypothetical protein
MNHKAGISKGTGVKPIALIINMPQSHFNAKVQDQQEVFHVC